MPNDLGWHLSMCVCCAGSEFLLQSEWAWLSDEERAGSVGNHQAQPALDGQEPGRTPKMAVIQALHPVSAPLTGNRGVSSRQQQRLHYSRTVSLNSLYPGQSTNHSRRWCSTWVDKALDLLRLVLWVVFASSGWLWSCVWQEAVGCKHTLLTLYAVDQTSPLWLSSKPHAWADSHSSPTLLSLSLLSGSQLYELCNGHFNKSKYEECHHYCVCMFRQSVPDFLSNLWIYVDAAVRDFSVMRSWNHRYPRKELFFKLTLYCRVMKLRHSCNLKLCYFCHDLARRWVG